MWDGVYTADQAARGKTRFEGACIRCHNIELIGSERGPALKGTGFLTKYENDSWVDPGLSFGMVKAIGKHHDIERIRDGNGAKSSITETPQEMPGMGEEKKK